MRFASVLALACIALAALATPAAAQTAPTAPSGPQDSAPDIDPAARAAAQALFEEGRALRIEMRWEEALAKFSASHKLDPAVGTLLNIADCHLALGRTASAWLHYTDAITVAHGRGDSRREAYARERAATVEKQLARLRIEVTRAAPDLAVTRSGVPVPSGQWSSAVPVDPGMHRIQASAPGRQSWESVVDVTNPGATAEVVVPELAPSPSPTPARIRPPSDGAGADAPSRTKKVVGWVAAVTGAVGLGVGIGFEIRAHMLEDASRRYCPDDPHTCTPAGADLRDDALVNERVAIVALGAGTAVLGVGAVLLVVDAIDGGKAKRSAAVQPTGDGVRFRW